jgi:hypothetical protein
VTAGGPGPPAAPGAGGHLPRRPVPLGGRPSQRSRPAAARGRGAGERPASEATALVEGAEHVVALAYNLANALWQLALPRSIRSWTLTTLREKLVKIGAKVVSHSKYVIFQLAEVAVPRQLFAAILGRIGRLRLACASGQRARRLTKRSERRPRASEVPRLGPFRETGNGEVSGAAGSGCDGAGTGGACWGKIIATVPSGG